MASVKISALTSAGALAGTEPLPVVQSGTTKKATAQAIADLANAYTDTKVNGLSWKQAVRAATTATGTLATAYENGDTIDGVTLATGDRILIKNQSSGDENGIYVVAASGAPTRASDANSGAELVNASVYVSEGTTLADTQWTCTTNATITVGSTSLAFAQLSSGGGITALTGDVTASGTGSVAATIANDAVTYAKMQNVSATSRLLGRKTAAAGDTEECTLSEILDFIGSAAQGDILYRGASTWARLGAGTSGQVLTTAGAGANPSWAAAGGGTGKQTIPVMAVAMSPRQSAGCANIAWIVGASGQPDIPYLAFDPSTIEYAEFALEMPKSWDESTITFEPIWTHPATATNFGTVWKLEAVAVADSATMLASFGTGQTSTDTGGNTSYRYKGPESAAITVGGSPTASNTVFCRLSRVPTDGSDTLAVDAYLTGIRIYYTTDASNDA